MGQQTTFVAMDVLVIVLLYCQQRFKEAANLLQLWPHDPHLACKDRYYFAITSSGNALRLHICINDAYNAWHLKALYFGNFSAVSTNNLGYTATCAILS